MKTLQFCLLFLLGLSIQATAQEEGPYDPTFGSNGVAQISGIGQTLNVNAVAVQSDGKIVCAGYNATANSQKDYMVLRLNADGTLDTSFGSGGISTSDIFGNGYDELLTSVRVLPGGQIQAGGVRNYNGSSDFDAFSVRLNSSGALESGYGNFSGTGYSSYGSSASEYMYGSESQADGSVVLVGDVYDGANNNTIIATFDSEGNPGLFTTLSIATNLFYRGVAKDPSGNIYFAGGNGSMLSIGKLNSAGDLVSAFDGDGIVTFDVAPGASNPYFSDVVYASNNKLLACGTTGFDIVISRRNADTGGADPSFNGGSPVVIDVWGANDQALSIQEYPDGRILVVGSGDYDSTDKDLVAIRLNPDGSRDASFGDNGLVFYHLNSENGTGGAIMSDGRIVVTGNGDNNPFVVRYLGEVLSASNEILPAAADIDLYPNPTSINEIQLEYLLEESTPVRIDLYSMDGRLINNLLSSDQLVGPQADLLYLPQAITSGTYLIRIQTNNGNSTIKLSVVR
ncbi:MAG: T9SS type A sorting domain-containing protein [Saprospiraceae bacterium]|nr:T9SS type A sorting domain-containing protein [Saprospiraceae bacterium]